MLFIKGFIIGLGKIMPGVSGAIIAIGLNLYEKLINAIIYFFNDWKKHIYFLFPIILGGLLAIIFGSKLLYYFLNNYRFFTMMFFLGLIIMGTYNFSFLVEYNKLNIGIIFGVILGGLFLGIININLGWLSTYNVSYFLGGYISVMASIIPGISSTALLIVLGIYDNILLMVANLYNFSYVLDNLWLYFLYLFGMIISFIINILLVNYCLKKHHKISYAVILGLSIISIIYLLKETITIDFNVFGLCFLIIGIVCANALNKVSNNC
jgi:putative membrane protein